MENFINMENLLIKKEEVYKEVAELISCVEVYSEATGIVIGCQVMNVKDGPFEFFWRDACCTVTTEVKKYLTSVSSPSDRDKPDSKEVFTIELKMPSKFKESPTTYIEEEIHSFFVNSIANKLLLSSRKDVASKYEKQATSSLQNARRILFQRKPPVRVPPTIE